MIEIRLKRSPERGYTRARVIKRDEKGELKDFYEIYFRTTNRKKIERFIKDVYESEDIQIKWEGEEGAV